MFLISVSVVVFVNSMTVFFVRIVSVSSTFYFIFIIVLFFGIAVIIAKAFSLLSDI